MAASTDLFSTVEASPFGRRQRGARGARIPVTVVTGFLGSGKTTLIRELLRRPEGAKPRSSSTNTARSGSKRSIAGVERRDGIAGQRLPVLHGAHRPAGKPARAVRRSGARRGAEFRAGHDRNQRPCRSRPGAADIRERTGAWRGISSAIAGHGDRCGQRQGEPRPDARGTAPSGVGRPIVLSKTDTADAAATERLTGTSSGIQRGANCCRGRTAPSSRAFCSTRRPICGADRGASATTTRMHIRTELRASRCFSTPRYPGRYSSRSWRC